MQASFDTQKILLVDDEASSRTLVSRMLRRLGFAEVLVAEDGYSAIEVLNKRPDITAVMIDFRMPGLHGLQLLKIIRTGGTAAPRNIVCAMLTSYAERHLVGLAIVLDVDTFLAKPVSLDTLTKHMTRCFQYRFEPLPVDAYINIEVDNAAPHLTGGAPKVEITPAERQALAQPDPEIPEADLAPPVAQPPAAKTPETKAPETKAPPPAANAGAKATQKSATPATSSFTAQILDSDTPAKKVKLSEVAENAVLARDLIGTSGTLLLAAGTRFKARYAKRLEELGDIREKVEYVWVVDE